LNAKYNPKTLTSTLEEEEITDSGLKRYWKTITRIVFEIDNPKLKGKNEIVISQVK
jgi:hypothetical protein